MSDERKLESDSGEEVGRLRKRVEELEKSEAQRKLIEAELLESKERFRIVADFTYDWEYWRSPSRTLIYVSPSCHRVTGYEPREFLQDPSLMDRLVHPDDLPVIERHRREGANGKEGPPIDFRIMHRDGQQRWVNHVCQPVWGPLRQYLGRRASNREVTALKQAQEKVRAEQRFRKAIEDSLLAGVSVVDLDGTQTYVNPAFCRMVGWNEEELVGDRPPFVYWPPEEIHAIEEAFRAALHGKATASGFDLRFVRRTGERFDAVVLFSPLNDDHGQTGGWLALVYDVTERKRAQEERRDLEARLLQSQKLKSLGLLAEGIAHDFSNQLARILTNAELALCETPADSPLRPLIQQIESTASHTAELSRQLLAYSGRGEIVLESLDLSNWVRETAPVLESLLGSHHVVSYRLAEALGIIEADPKQLRQVLVNLISNADHAIGDKAGEIVVRTGLRRCHLEYLSRCHLGEHLPEGMYAYLEVRDTGCGMKEEMRERIFDPFFTSKSGGHGLGLAVVQGIVRAHQGAIHVESKPGRGTAFKILFPQSVRQRDTPGKNSDTDLRAWRSSGAALVVDDDKEVRQLAQIALERAGFQVFAVADGQQAVDSYRKTSEALRFVLMDLTLPLLDGEKAYDEMCGICDSVPVILTSGYGVEEASSKFASRGYAGFLQKPYQLVDLLRVVRQVVDPSG